MLCNFNLDHHSKLICTGRLRRHVIEENDDEDETTSNNFVNVEDVAPSNDCNREK